MGVGGQRHAPAAITPGKTRYPLYRRLGRPQNQPGRVRKTSPPPGFYPRTVHPIASGSTDCVICMYRQYVEVNCKVHDPTVFNLGNIALICMGALCSGGKDRQT
jgi:hypothetical protein